MPFLPIQPVRPRRPQVGGVGKATAASPSKLPRGPIMARGIARVMVGVAIITPMPKARFKVRPPVVARVSPPTVAARQPLITPLPRRIRKNLAPIIVSAPAAPRAGGVSITRLPFRVTVVTTRPVASSLIVAPRSIPAAGRAIVSPRLPIPYVPPVITRRVPAPLIVAVKPAPIPGKAIVGRLTTPAQVTTLVYYVDTPPILGHTYYYRWRASDGNFYSAYGPTASASTNLIPVQVTGLTATGGAGQIVLDWADIAGADSYTVYASLYPADPAPAVIASGLTESTYTYIVSDTVLHYFTVSAVNSCGEGARSAEVYAIATAADHDCGCDWNAGPTGSTEWAGGPDCDTEWAANTDNDTPWSETGPC